jgi:hypothetical protein
MTGRGNPQLGLERLALRQEPVGVGIDKTHIVFTFFDQNSGDFEAEVCGFGRCLNRRKCNVPYRRRLVAEEELLDEAMDLIVTNCALN